MPLGVPNAAVPVCEKIATSVTGASASATDGARSTFELRV
jgi:hypothetical protein